MTERTALVTARKGIGSNGLSLVRTRQSYRTISKAPGQIDAAPEFMDQLRKIREVTLAQLRATVPIHAGMRQILDVTYDEATGLYELCMGNTSMKETHKQTREPREITFRELCVKLCEFVPILEFISEIIQILAYQRRVWFINVRRDLYQAPATALGDAITDSFLDPPQGHLRHYMLWVNDLALRLTSPMVWKQREIIFRGPVPEHVRRVEPSPRTDSMSTMDPSAEEDEDTAEEADETDEVAAPMNESATIIV